MLISVLPLISSFIRHNDAFYQIPFLVQKRIIERNFIKIETSMLVKARRKIAV